MQKGRRIRTKLDQPRENKEGYDETFHDHHSIPTEFIGDTVNCVVGALLCQFRRDVFVEHGIDGEDARCDAEEKMYNQHHPIEIKEAAPPQSRSKEPRTGLRTMIEKEAS
jgi:hypothetical protein